MSTRAAVRFALPIALLLAAWTAPAGAEDGHPYILWTPEEAKALRRTIESEPWAKKAYDALPDKPLPNLLRYVVMGDEAAGRAEKKRLLSGKGDRLTQAFRFDCLYDLLTPAERKTTHDKWTRSINGAIKTTRNHGKNRFNWLPNLGYVWYRDLHVMALALRDEALARKIFTSPWGFKWYLDDYASDLGFYNEEFGKQFVRAGAMMLWVRAADRMGLEDIGSEYVGERGATFRGYVESLLRVGMPAVDLGTERPFIPRLTMGDAKGSHGAPAYGFQHYLAHGYLLDRPTARVRTYDGGHLPQWAWFEIAHKKWPNAGFGYPLVARRGPDEDKYYPTLYFGLDPIDPETVTRPPGANGVYPARGLVVLRAEQGPAYWTSPAPALGMRLATPYAHHVYDAFSILEFYAFNRQIFQNHQHSTNYSGVDPAYSNSIRSHSGVMVDFAEPKTIGKVPTRHNFTPAVKFAAGRAYGVYEGVDMTRGLMLTREYLVDVFRLASDRPRHYQWMVQTFGHACPDAPRRWTPSHDLVGSQFDVARERSLATGGTWTVAAVQTSQGAHRRFSGFGERWFEERIGVRTTVLGEPGTTAYHAWAPVVSDSPGHWTGRDRFAYGEDEPAAVAISAIRKTPQTAFVAVHEPFKRSHRIASVERIAQDGGGVVARIQAVANPRAAGGDEPFTDYVMMRYGPGAEKTVTMRGEGAAFTFADHGYVRVAGDRVSVEGEIESLRIPVGDARPELHVARKKVDAAIEGGWLIWPKADVAEAKAAPPEAEPQLGPIAARWPGRIALCLPRGSEGIATLELRNAGQRTVTAKVLLAASGDILTGPAELEVKDFKPGEERRFEIGICGAAASGNRLRTVELDVEGPEGLEIQRALLKVANGMVVEHDQRMRGDPTKTIYGPRYIARFHYMASGCASLLLDPAGHRRTGAGGLTQPGLVRRGIDRKGRDRWIADQVVKFPYFVPVVVPGKGDEPPYIYEAGRHAHGTTSSIEHWFTEDWILIRYRRAEKDERIAFDWHRYARKCSLPRTIPGRRADLMAETMPGKVLVATPDGQIRDATRLDERRHKVEVRLPKGVEQVAALFRRPHGYAHGTAEFYPAGSRWEKRWVTQPGDAPMGFTYCREEEFADLVRKWLADVPDGEVRPEARGRYNGAFMPHLHRPHDAPVDAPEAAGVPGPGAE